MMNLVLLAAVLAQVPEIPPDTRLPRVDEVEVLAQILEAEDRREATAALRQLADHDDPGYRARAALALARVGDPTTLSRLSAMTGDGDLQVRAMAAFALGRLDYELMVSAHALRTRALEILLPLLDDDPAVAEQAAWAIGLVDGGAVDAVRERLGTAGQSPALIAALLTAWWRLEGADVETAATFAAHAHVEVRLAAALALRRIDDPNGLPTLVSLLEDADVEVQLMAARGLTGAPRRVAEERAVPLLGDRDRRIVCAVLGWLESAWSADGIAGDVAFEAVLRRSFDRALHVRRCALRALGALAATRAVAADRLLEALGEEEEAVRVASLGRLADQRADLIAEATRRVLGEDELSPAKFEFWAKRPLEEAAVARLFVAARRDELIDGWLAQTEGASHIAMLSALVAEDGQRVYRRLLELPLEDDGVLGLIGRAHVAASMAIEPAVIAELADRLWRLYYDTPIGDPRRHAALRTLTIVDPDLAERRRELVFADGDRSIRDWAARQWGDDGADLPELGVLLAPHWTDRTSADYSSLAREVARLRQQFPRVLVETERGVAVIELRPDWAPLTVVQFARLVGEGFFDGSSFYRVIAGFVTQGGGSPTGAPARKLRNEDTPIAYDRGVLGMALSGRDTGTVHFFVTQAPQPHLRGEYPIFGRVVEGQRVLERIQPGDRMQLRLQERE